jgi:hypothetical protein
MDTKKQHDMFKSLKGTVEKLQTLKKSMADKTTDAIIADIEDSNSTAQVAPNPGLSSKNPTMVKGKPKDQSKGVHKPYVSQGTSMAGELAQEGKNKPQSANKEVSRALHSQNLKQLKDIKPNLPKSEGMLKTEEFIADLKKIRDDLIKQESEPKFDKLKAFIQKREDKRNK